MKKVTILNENEVNKIKYELEFIRKLTYNIEKDNGTSYVIDKSVNSIIDHLNEISNCIGN